jgi:tetratricopeptide (TPR) repeat protein
MVRDRLARSLAARARVVLQREVIFLGVLRNSQALMKSALELAPDNPFIWRLAIDLAAMLEDGDAGADTWLSDGLAKLSKLEPDDEVLRLRRVMDAIDERQTAEARVEASKAMLTPAAIAQLGRRVAARVAFDLAALSRRTGDGQAFEKYLLFALELDPYFPEATETAAGYFRMNAPTVVDEVHAMRDAALANPSRSTVALGLAELCLQQGAYRAAASILDIAYRMQQTRGPDENVDALLSDFIIALWGTGRIDNAFSHAKQRTEQLDSALLQEIEKQGMATSAAERATVHLPPTPTLATTIAALSTAVDVKPSPIVVANAAFAFDTMIAQVKKRNAAPQLAASLALDSAFVQLWLGWSVAKSMDAMAKQDAEKPADESATKLAATKQTDNSVEKAQSLIAAAVAYEPLTDETRARFDGWIALRTRDAAKAKAILAPIAANDLASKLGLALACDELGETKEAARLLLEIARATPSTAVGLWSRSRLYQLIGATPVILPQAEEVETAAELPRGFLKLMNDGSASMLLRVTPREIEARPWDALIFDIELTNRSAWPLSIGPDGPIKDSTTITASLNVPGEMPRPPQIVLVSIDQKFVIDPGETLKIPVDISVTDASAALREDALSGAFISLHSIINWRTTSVGFEPSPYGIEVESPVVHVSGERLTREWVERVLTQLRDLNQVPNPENIALIASAIVRKAAFPALVPADAGALLDEAGPLLADAAKRLWPEARAWLIFACPKGKRIDATPDSKDLLDMVAPGGGETAATVPELEALDAVLREDESPLVRISWIAVRARRPEDLVLVQSLSSTDALTRGFAEDCKQWMIEARDERAKQLNLKK